MPRSTRLQTAAQGYIDREQFASIEWLVEAKGQILSTGKVDPKAGSSIPTDALYRIYSMTKPIVSVMALMLIEQGKLRLYDALAQFNPAFAGMRVLHASGRLEPAVRPILVEDLLTHRSGFTYEFITGCHIAPGYDAVDLSSDGSCSLDEMMLKLARSATGIPAWQPVSLQRLHRCPGPCPGKGQRPEPGEPAARTHPGTAGYARHRFLCARR